MLINFQRKFNENKDVSESFQFPFQTVIRFTLQREKYLSYVVFVRIRFCIGLFIRK